MPGIPGRGGPPPKAQRRHRGKPAVPGTTLAAGGRKVPVPRGDPKWHPAAKRLYRSLADSGQRTLYEPSDFATAWLLAEAVSRELSPQPVMDKDGNVTMLTLPPKAAAVTAWLKALAALLATEGARRLARLELERPAEDIEPGDVSWIDDARRRLQADPPAAPPT